MKQRLFFIIIPGIVLLFAATESFANDVYAFLISKDLPQTQAIVIGFKGSFPEAEIVTYDLQGKSDPVKIKEFIKTTNPAIIICLGSLAAKSVIEVEHTIPVIFTMVINFKKYPELKQDNVTGISMEIPYETLFTQFKFIYPELTSIGVPFSPTESADIVTEASDALQKMGVKLIKIEIDDPKEITTKLSKQAKGCSGLWMLADTKLYNRETQAIQELIAFSREKNIPLLAFSEAFLKPGAFFSISIDYRSLGSQLSLIAKQIVVDKTKPNEIEVTPPIGTFTVLNKVVAQQLFGPELDETIFEEMDRIYPDDMEQ